MTVYAWIKRRRRARRERKRSRTVALLLLVSHAFSITLLLVVLNAAVINEQTPPFYGWLRNTWLEKIGLYTSAQIREQHVLWRRRFLARPLGRDEMQAREVLREQIERSRPTHQVLLHDGTMLFGVLQQDDDDRFVLSYDGDSGRTRRALAPDQIRHTRELQYSPAALTARDVRFLLEYPGYNYSLLPPYLFVHDAPFSMVVQAYRVLQDLDAEFRTVFRAVRRAAGIDTKKVYVCFFRDEDTYRKNAVQKEDVDLERSVGFYSQLEDCLFLYDRLQSFARTRIDRNLDRYVEQLEQLENAPSATSIRQFEAAEKQRLYSQLREEVLTTLRHEGAHQLAFALGVHSVEGYEHLWLEEGLAQFWETRPPGAPLPLRLRLLGHGLAAGELIPWQGLIDTPTPRGFSYYGDRSEYAYGQSWLLFCYLMDSAMRPAFMRYLVRVRDMSVTDIGRRRSELFEEVLGQSVTEIGAALEDRIRAFGSQAESG